MEIEKLLNLESRKMFLNIHFKKDMRSTILIFSLITDDIALEYIIKQDVRDIVEEYCI